MQRGGAPVAVEKIEQASSAKIFSGTARRRGQIRRGYLWSASVRSTDLFFPIIEGKTIFVSSTAKRQRGLQRGKLGSPLPCFASFCRSKRKAPAASGDNYAFAKGPAPPPGAHKLALNSHNKSQLHFPNKTHHLSNSHPVFPHFVNLP